MLIVCFTSSLNCWLLDDRDCVLSLFLYPLCTSFPGRDLKIPGIAACKTSATSIGSCAEWWELLRRMFLLVNTGIFFLLLSPGFSWLRDEGVTVTFELFLKDLSLEIIYRWR